MRSVGCVNFAEAFYRPTYHVKDFSMYFIGHFLKYLVRKDEENDRVCSVPLIPCSTMCMRFSLERTVTRVRPCLPERDTSTTA